jgi:hypothetical protein
LVRTLAGGTMVAASSRDGQVLWKAPLPGSWRLSMPLVAAGPRNDGPGTPAHLVESFLTAAAATANGAKPRSTDGKPSPRGGRLGDFDGDGTVDLFGYAAHTSSSGRFQPLHAVSGRTGQTL